MKFKTAPLLLTLLILGVVGCANQPNAEIMAGANQVELRSIQTRAFDTTDTTKMMRAVIATMQDLGFIVDKADTELGSVTGTKISGYQIRMTVIARPKGEIQLAVRMNAYYNKKAIEDPVPYQDFFTSLGKALFLTAHKVD
jgi:hypothetical protein